MIRLLLVDDHPVVRTGYQRLLEQAGDISVVAQADRVDLAYAEFVARTPDVTVTDLSMPGSGGLELIRRILARDAAARVLVFSMHDSALLVRRAFDAGARGFLSKSSAPEKLIEAVPCSNAMPVMKQASSIR
jgi:DNA-binding NarL/FixJ family response regulator